MNGKATVINGLFTAEIHEQIVKYLDEVQPLIPLDRDRPIPGKYGFNRDFGHNLPFFAQIHDQLTGFATEMFGEPVKPSYSFLSRYKTDGACPLHLDRPQCRYTIDYQIRNVSAHPWLLRVGEEMSEEALESVAIRMPNTAAGIEKIIQSENWTDVCLNDNDAVAYSGTHCWHYRPDKSTEPIDMVFFHFVPEAFSDSLS